eukprot:SAG11_NODE_3049_length_2732_cov_1.898595_3_plen_91_part_00
MCEFDTLQFFYSYTRRHLITLHLIRNSKQTSHSAAWQPAAGDGAAGRQSPAASLNQVVVRGQRAHLAAPHLRRGGLCARGGTARDISVST